jgi:hypothetical protein
MTTSTATIRQRDAGFVVECDECGELGTTMRLANAQIAAVTHNQRHEEEND